MVLNAPTSQAAEHILDQMNDNGNDDELPTAGLPEPPEPPEPMKEEPPATPKLSIKEIKQKIVALGGSTNGCIERADLEKVLAICESRAVAVPVAVPAAAPSHATPSVAPAAARLPQSVTEAADVVKNDTGDLSFSYHSPIEGPKHPTPLRVSSTLEYAAPAAVDASALNAVIDPRVRGPLSDVQLHAVALATRAAMNGKAFVLGDGTGCGKGRQAMGFVMNLFCKAPAGVRLRGIYLSHNGLFTAAKRDFRNCGVTRLFPNVKLFDLRDLLPTAYFYLHLDISCSQGCLQRIPESN